MLFGILDSCCCWIYFLCDIVVNNLSGELVIIFLVQEKKQRNGQERMRQWMAKEKRKGKGGRGSNRI